VQWEEQTQADQYWILPLATIAADVEIQNSTVCKIFVQELFTDSKSVLNMDYSIIMGAMFFQ